MHLFDKNVTTAVEFVGAIFPYITYGVVFVQFHWLINRNKTSGFFTVEKNTLNILYIM
jgi:hypothetical protein